MVGTLIAMMFVWVAAHRHEIASAQAMLTDVARQDEQIRIHAEKKAVLEAERAHLLERERLVEELSSPTQLAFIFSDMSKRVPDTVVLTKLQVYSPGLTRYAALSDPAVTALPSGAAAPARKIEESRPMSAVQTSPQLQIVGIARSPRDVIAFAAALETSPLFDRVQILTQKPAAWSGRQAEMFEITCDLLEQQGDAR